MNCAKWRFAFCLILVCIWFGSWPAPVSADQDAEGRDDKIETVAALQSLASSLEQVEQELQDYWNRMKSQEGKIRLEELQKQIVETLAEKEKLQRTFEEIASGVDLDVFEEKLQAQFDWAQELKDLLSPLLGELRAVTNRPRELERLKREVAYYKSRIPIIEKSLTRLAMIRTDVAYLAHTPQGQALTERLLELETDWREKLKQNQGSLAASEHQLSEKMAERQSLINSARNLFAIFFRSRGRNLAVAILVFLFFLLGSLYLHRVIDRVSPWHRAKKRKFMVRLFDVFFYVLTVVGSTLSALIVLYLFEDWVLLVMTLILLFGLAWAARKGLPVFWRQAQLMLNFGSVREGEIVILDGVPWMVETINVYTHLVNPLLKGGKKRLPIRDLLDMRSRHRAEDEPWFPCREDDWVIMADGARGKVVCQTPDQVELVKLGGSHKVYPIRDFISQSPLNISRGFRLDIVFGVDYRHQAKVTTEIMAKMRQDILQGLTEAGNRPDLVSLKVEFRTAGASSLDLNILADFSGRAAHKYCILDRLINRLAVDACNRHGWIIPFTQVTVHQADKPEAGKIPPSLPPDDSTR